MKLSLINKQTKTHRSYEADTFEELYLILRDKIKLDSLGEELEGYINKTYNFIILKNLKIIVVMSLMKMILRN